MQQLQRVLVAAAGFSVAASPAFDRAHADDPRTVPKNYYQLSTEWQGFCKSLDIVNDRERRTPVLAKTDYVSGQHWKVTPAADGYFYLETEWQGPGKRLDILNDGANDKPVLAAAGAYSGQQWRIDPAGGDHYFLSTKWQGAGKRLDIVNDATASRPALAWAAHVSGQKWRFTRVARVGPPPAALRANAFYKKHVDADGIPILSSNVTPDAALYRARFIVMQMLSGQPDVRDQMIRNGARVAIMAATEGTTDIPEHSGFNAREDACDALDPATTPDPNDVWPDYCVACPSAPARRCIDWNKRARGLGGAVGAPLTTGSEENLICQGQAVDRYDGEDIFLHEFAHAIHGLGLSLADPSFDTDLQFAFDEATRLGRWQENDDIYALDNPSEYFAEGVQSWFNVNQAPGGVHNDVDTRGELETYDPLLYALIAKHFPADVSACSCQ